ncbi:hypothetical protein ACROYT_G035442 [Oculina patagonica]
MSNIYRKRLVCNRNYYRKAKRKTRSIAQDKIDIDGILGGSSGAGSFSKPVANTATKSPGDITAVEMWQGSDERTTLLKKGEKRVAIIAVATMLIAFVGIKSMVYVAEKWKTPSDTAVDQQP